jgi:hypothetical protein
MMMVVMSVIMMLKMVHKCKREWSGGGSMGGGRGKRVNAEWRGLKYTIFVSSKAA